MNTFLARPILAATVLLGVSLPAGAQAPVTLQASPARAPLEHAVDAVVVRAMRAPIAGLTIAVARGDEILLEKGYGTADLVDGRAADRETIYEIGSVTKQFTAAAVLRLVESGELSLDDAIVDHLPTLGDRADGITIRHLLTHTSGLSSAPAVTDQRTAATPAAVADTLAARAVEFAPGERFAYNNNGYILLGLLIEKVTGAPYAEHVTTTFFEPLGLESIGPCDRFPSARRAKGYRHPTRGATDPEPAPAHHPTVTYSAGMMCASAGDLVRWEVALAEGRATGPEGYRLMTTPASVASGRTVGYGMGMQIQEMDGRTVLGHGGGLPGFIADVVRLPEDDLTVVVLTNGVYAGQIVRQATYGIARAALGLPAVEVADVATTSAERAGYTGTFEVGPLVIEVFEQGDHLRALPEGQIATRLLYQGDGTFRAEHDPSVYLRFRVMGGRAEELELEQGGRKMPPGRRVR